MEDWLGIYQESRNWKPGRCYVLGWELSGTGKSKEWELVGGCGQGGSWVGLIFELLFTSCEPRHTG